MNNRKKNRKLNQMSSADKELIKLVLGMIVLIILAGVSLQATLNSIEVPSPKVVKQNATTYNINYIVEEYINLNGEEQVEQFIKNRENEIFGLDLLENVEYKYSNTEISSDMIVYTFNQYYKDILVKDSDIYVTVENDRLIDITGIYIEPINFEVQPEITESTAYETVLEKLKDEYKPNGETIPEISKLGKKIIALKDKYIMLVYEFKYSETNVVVDAITGEIVNY